MKFSVVIPLYNKAPFVLHALGSVEKQRHRAEEVIVVDDGSTDEGAQRIAEAFPWVRLVLQENTGPGMARNAGLQIASSSWVALLDADDYWLPGHLEELAEVIRRIPDSRLAGTAFEEVTGSEAEPGLRNRIVERRAIDYFREAARSIAILQTSAVAVHTDTALRVGGFGRARLGEDLELWARIALHHPVAHSTAVTAHYRRGVGGLVESGEADLAGEESPRQAPVDLSSLSPSAALVVGALRSGDHLVPREDLLLYLDGRVSSAMLQCLVRGDVEGARSLRHLLHQPRRQPGLFPTALTTVPAPLFRGALAARKRARGLRSSRT